jgi:hypothetical protein
MEIGYWCAIAGAAGLTADLALRFLVFGETCCGIADYVLMQDIIGAAECSKFAFVKARISAWFALVLGVSAMLCSLLGNLVLRDRT